MALPHIPLLQPLGAGAHGSTQDLVGRGQEAPPGFVLSPHQYFGQSRSHSKHTRWSVGMVCAASEAHEIQRNPQALLLGEAEARLKFGHLISLMPKWLCCHQAQY